MRTEINELITSTKHISCQCKYKVGGRKCNLNQKQNIDKYLCESLTHVYEKHYISIPVTCSCENNKYVASIINNLVITCVKIIGEAKTYNNC